VPSVETFRLDSALKLRKREGTDVAHASDEAVENYALSRLAESEVNALEEHLLACKTCLIRVEIEISFVELFRVYSALYPKN
jgi:hypothetical protein